MTPGEGTNRGMTSESTVYMSMFISYITPVVGIGQAYQMTSATADAAILFVTVFTLVKNL